MLLNRSLALRSVLAFVATLALSVVAAPAADLDEMTAKIPFEFIAGGKTMPAGNYTIEVGPGVADPSVVLLQTRQTKDGEFSFKRVLVATTPADRVDDAQPHLVFDKVGDLYFLDRVVPRSGTVEKVR